MHLIIIIYLSSGITQKLPYLKDTGVDAIWMSPMFQSPMYDFGYDISDYKKIAPEYGTMQDFEELMRTAKILGKEYQVLIMTSSPLSWLTSFSVCFKIIFKIRE